VPWFGVHACAAPKGKSPPLASNMIIIKRSNAFANSSTSCFLVIFIPAHPSVHVLSEPEPPYDQDVQGDEGEDHVSERFPFIRPYLVSTRHVL